MATYMLAYSLPKESRHEALKRFNEGGALPPPAGVNVIGRWHAAAGRLTWVVLDADDPKQIADWVLPWSDLVDYELHPVVSDGELGELLRKHRPSG